MKKLIAVAKGDGVGPEIMDVVINIFQQLNVPLNYVYVDLGKQIFLSEHKIGMTKSTQNKVEELGILFKGPVETPKDLEDISIDVMARKLWGTFANCRVFKSLPGVETIYNKCGIPIDLTIIHENLEDIYCGIEHMLTSDLAIARRFTSAPGVYQIHKYAFEYAKKNNISSIICAHKANIMKMTDGMYLEIFYEIGKEYPEINTSDITVDNLCMQLVTNPSKYQLIVLPNLHGDIVADLCAGLVGGLGFVPSANIGNDIAIFEAIHGTAPDIAGKNIANPTALLMSGLMMLKFLGLYKEAKRIELALLKTLEDNIYTSDMKNIKNPVSTKEFGEAIIENAISIKDDHPELQNLTNKTLITFNKKNDLITTISYRTKSSVCKGIDIFIESLEDPEIIAGKFNILLTNKFIKFNLEIIANRGSNVFPNSSKYIECINSYVVRILSKNEVTEKETIEVLMMATDHFKILSAEILREYDSKLGFSII